MRPARAATRPGHLLPAWLPPPPLDVSRNATTSPGPSSLAPSPSLSPWIPLSSPPSGARRRRRCYRGHSHPLAPLTCPRAPGRLPHPLHQAMELWTRHNIAGIAVSIAGRRGSSPSIRHHRRFPELADHLYATHVSSATVSPSSPLRLIVVAVAPLITEMHHRLSSPSMMLG